ncbi:DUF3267 domain-containing protein [Brunnivagina elsteri]|uniref:DUF3267 domain-containing protein n=1 Tax=Brunnivagina elsteri CCALA 953 TaxID=987040 RepID=A0A2A2TCW9_9CYAN|nr:DUF3267 domain-containing protein [Calothrix elsteri]PAX51647.1 hypothetical protein CK510_23675 [Calothrix elsteri CCALA 953]
MLDTNSTSTTPGTLPKGYQEVLYDKINKPLRIIVLQILSIPLFVVFGLIFLNVAIGMGKLPSRIQIGLTGMILLLAGTILTLVLHELTHGVVMRMFGAKPRYGVLWKQAMFYATTPGYAYRRNDYLLITLAPLSILSILVILGMWFVQGTLWVALFAICGTINASGAIGDIWISIIVLRYTSTAYVMDERDGIRVFLPNLEVRKKGIQNSLAQPFWKRIAFIRFLHTAIFVFFNIVMAVLLYEVVADKISILTWIALAFFAIEVIVLIANNWTCPLTIYAEKLESYRGQTTDIFFLPKWFGDRMFIFYGGLLVFGLLLLVIRLLT